MRVEGSVIDMYVDASTDRLHDHLTIGFRRGCTACAQMEADLKLSGEVYLATLPVTETNTAHPKSTDAARAAHLTTRVG